MREEPVATIRSMVDLLGQGALDTLFRGWADWASTIITRASAAIEAL